jgi:hypothetical protein
MKTRILLAGLTLALTGMVRAGLYYNGTGGIIPDGSLGGMTRQIQSSDVGTISSVSILFNLSGGFNGDLYGYLTYNDGSSSKTEMLLNHIGGGSSAAAGSGFGTGSTTTDYTSLLANGVKLVDGAAGNIQNVTPLSGESVPVGSYTPDSAVSFNTTFCNMNGSGTWTLFFADTAPGDESTMVSWGLDVGIAAVPEPVNVALSTFAGIFLVVILARSRPVRNRIGRWRVAVGRWIDAV